MLTFAGGVATSNMLSTSKGMQRVVADERLWKVFCKEEIPGFDDAHLSMPKAKLLKGANILAVRAMSDRLAQLVAMGADAAVVAAARASRDAMGADHGRPDPWSEAQANARVGDEAAAGVVGAESAEKPAAKTGTKRTYRAHYVLVTAPRIIALQKHHRDGFDAKLTKFRGGAGVRLVRKQVKI
jgi:hypothetical protein